MELATVSCRIAVEFNGQFLAECFTNVIYHKMFKAELKINCLKFRNVSISSDNDIYIYIYASVN